MGKRVHVIKRHEEYGDSEAFNWRYEEFKDMLGCLNCYMCSEEYACDRFECVVSEYKTALKLAKAYKKNGRTKKVIEKFEDNNADIDEFEDYLDGLGGIDNVVENMQAFYEERDKKSSWISFAAW